MMPVTIMVTMRDTMIMVTRIEDDAPASPPGCADIRLVRSGTRPGGMPGVYPS